MLILCIHSKRHGAVLVGCRAAQLGRMYNCSRLTCRVAGVQFALPLLLKPFAWAIAPMENRLDALKPPLTFIYGDQDWMDPEAANRICERLKSVHCLLYTSPSPRD